MTFIPKDCKILIVDDSPSHIQYLGNILKEENFSISFAQNGESALSKVQTIDFDLILLDVIMPEISGFEVCKYLKNNEKTKDIPVIFLTADIEHTLKGFEVGGVDYVIKPFNSTELIARVKTHLQLVKTQKELKRTNSLLSQTVHDRTIKLQRAIEELDVFFYRASHDIRGPLATLDGLNYLFEKEVDDRKSLEYHGLIKDTLAKLIELNNSIISVGKIRAHHVKIQVLNFRDLVSGVLDKIHNFQQLADTEFDFDPTHKIETDPELLEEILLSVIQNALQYHRPYQRASIILKFRIEQGYQTIQIKDKGQGIAKELIPKIFNMFFKGNNNSVGFGLGLYKASLAVDALHGKIFCESVPGQGTTISIVLPLNF